MNLIGKLALVCEVTFVFVSIKFLLGQVFTNFRKWWVKHELLQNEIHFVAFGFGFSAHEVLLLTILKFEP